MDCYLRFLCHVDRKAEAYAGMPGAIVLYILRQIGRIDCMIFYDVNELFLDCPHIGRTYAVLGFALMSLSWCFSSEGFDGASVQ